MNRIREKGAVQGSAVGGNGDVGTGVTERSSVSLPSDVVVASKSRRTPATRAAAPSPAGTAARVVRRKVGARGGDETKASIVMKKLNQARGATVAQLMEATGWQAHSVRGFLSAAVRKKAGLDLASEVGKDGLRRYRIVGVSSKATSQ